ncbi:MAG: hypothetical protein NTU62_04685 [Spirochaetes bacterium]|nr:hypothetical protein [Spirochaetota bacterium]
MKRCIRILAVVDLAGSLLLAGCPVPPSDDCELTAFALAGVTGTIDQGSVAVTVPWGTDVVSLAAVFATTGVSASIGSTILESGVTPCDYTDPVTLTVLAEDGSAKDYTVTVTLPDAYEPNETLNGYQSLGTVFETATEQQWTATISPTVDRDFYWFMAEEDGGLGFPLESELFTLTVRLVPPQAPHARNYDLYLFADGGGVLEQSTTLGSAEEIVVFAWDGTVGIDDSQSFRLEVRGVDGAFTCSPYTLYADLVETIN